jgi:hypothetical protein
MFEENMIFKANMNNWTNNTYNSITTHRATSDSLHLTRHSTPLLITLLFLNVLFWTLTFHHQTAFALESDRNQVLQIQADSAELDENRGTAIYKGSVELSQGSLLIKANILTIYSTEEALAKSPPKGAPPITHKSLMKTKPLLMPVQLKLSITLLMRNWFYIKALNFHKVETVLKAKKLTMTYKNKFSQRTEENLLVYTPAE